ncbi:hypothetical protein HPP92_022586 [Vanilla planifolia]|uniref:WRKY domain-containing protein n=1 Tax=Vanilla planifolia TaxID=51239 RepID=A0A835UFJ8_VANPL|nr:hypothetical protein HPP92_022586 [Vanilla planifolia]
MADSSHSSASADDATDHLSRGYERLTQLRALLLSSFPTEPRPTTLAVDLLDKSLRCLSTALFELQFGSQTTAPAIAKELKIGDYQKKKKKNTAHSWTMTTTVPHFDGHQWRKYGQKHINRAVFPRSYYKCAQSKEQGCHATKTVQRKNGGEDPPKYELSYSLPHTCKASELKTDCPFVMESSANNYTSCNTASPTGSQMSELSLQEASPRPPLEVLEVASHDGLSEQEHVMESMLSEAGKMNDELPMLSPFPALDFVDWEWMT